MKMKRTFMRTLVGVAVAAAIGGTLVGTSTAQQQQPPVKIGLLATLEGPFAAGGADGMRGAELAIKQRNGMAGGRKARHGEDEKQPTEGPTQRCARHADRHRPTAKGAHTAM